MAVIGPPQLTGKGGAGGRPIDCPAGAGRPSGADPSPVRPATGDRPIVNPQTWYPSKLPDGTTGPIPDDGPVAPP